MYCIALKSPAGNGLKISIDLKSSFRRRASNSHLLEAVDINHNCIFFHPGPHEEKNKVNQGEALN